MKTGIELIAEERERQISKEGWTPEHDDKHENAELAKAAATYACTQNNIYIWSILWPWKREGTAEEGMAGNIVPEWFKPTTPIRDLTKAGALIAAEIDRLQRRAASVVNDERRGPAAQDEG